MKTILKEETVKLSFLDNAAIKYFYQKSLKLYESLIDNPLFIGFKAKVKGTKRYPINIPHSNYLKPFILNQHKL